MHVLLQRAKLLLTLKAMSSAPLKGVPGGMSLLAVCTNGQLQESKVSRQCHVTSLLYLDTGTAASTAGFVSTDAAAYALLHCKSPAPADMLPCCHNTKCCSGVAVGETSQHVCCVLQLYRRLFEGMQVCVAQSSAFRDFCPLLQTCL